VNPAPTFQQWTLLRRMRAAGCPIDYRYLTLPSRPLTVVSHPLPLANGGATNVFRRDGQTWMALHVEMSVASTVRIGALRLRAHWLVGEASLVEPCLQHDKNYCLALYPEGKHWSISSQSVLNRWSRSKGILSRGVYITDTFWLGVRIFWRPAAPSTSTSMFASKIGWGTRWCFR